MPALSELSLRRLGTCHQDLQWLVRELAQELDLCVLCGHRTKEEQEKAYSTGNSKLRWPNSRHNSMPAEAVDLSPWPIDWKNLERFMTLGRAVKAKAAELGIDLTWGGDWTKFPDPAHYELRKRGDK